MKIKKLDFKKIHLQQIIMMIFILGIAIVVRREFKEINFKAYRSLLLDLSLYQRVLLVVVGLFSFLFALNYDFVLAKTYAPSLTKRQILKVAWISEGFNNFVGFGGLTGTGLRARNLKRYDIPGEKIFNYSLGAALVTDPGALHLEFAKCADGAKDHSSRSGLYCTDVALSASVFILRPTSYGSLHE